METLFTPTQAQVKRYLRLRAVSRELNQKILKTVPKRAFEEIGTAIGILRDGILVLDSESMTSVMSDCLLYDWYQGDKNIMQRYFESHPPQPGSDEDLLLHAYLEAEYTVLRVKSAVPGAGVHCDDLLIGGEIFVMDISMSNSGFVNYAAATRVVPMGDYWVTGGALLPIDREVPLEEAFEKIGGDNLDRPEGPSGVSIPIIRACLAAGAADRVRYEEKFVSPGKHQSRGHLPPKLPRRR